jgi:glucose-1-phosphatase
MTDRAIRFIFLDLGNVLVNLDYRKFSDQMTRLSGLDSERLRAVFAADKLGHRYEIGAISDEEFHSSFCRKIGVQIKRHDFFESWNGIFVEKPLLPEGLLSDLARRYSLWLVSNTNRMHFSFIRERYPMLDNFQGYILSYELGVAKPDPAIFRHAVRMASAQPSEALFVDDLLPNVEAARSVGIEAFQFVNTEMMLEELQARRIL